MSNNFIKDNKLEGLIDLKEEIYLVGGAIRDFLLEREIKDFDFIVKGDVKRLARNFADQNQGSFVTLDQQRKIYRVVIAGLEYDFSYFKSLREDLTRRDFTINALALNTENMLKFFSGQQKDLIIDYHQGQRDLEQGVIRQITKNSLVSDPLRVLRAARFSAVFDFTIKEQTLKSMQDNLAMLAKVANERIQAELIQLFTANNLAKKIRSFEEDLGLFSYLLPEVKKMKQLGKSRYHQQHVWFHSLRALEILETLLIVSKLAKDIDKEQIPLLKFALLFHDLGKVKAKSEKDGQIVFHGHEEKSVALLKKFLAKYSFSNQAKDYILSLIRHHMYPLYLFNAPDLTKRGRYRFLRRVGPKVPDLLLLSLADLISTREGTKRESEIKDYYLFIEGLVAEYRDFKTQKQNNLVSGADLIKELDLNEGPIIGYLLEQIAEAYAVGEIASKKAALAYATSLLAKEDN